MSSDPLIEAQAQPRILVVTLSNIGDVVMTTPVLEALAARYPDHLIDLLTDARSTQLLEAAPFVGTLWQRDKRAPWTAQLGLIRALRRTRYTLIVDLRTRIIGWLLRSPKRLFKPGTRVAGQHAVDEHFAALAPLTGDQEPPPCKVYLSAAHRLAAQQWLADLPGQRWLAVAPGANWPGKRWPDDHYRELINLQSANFDAAIIVAGRADLARPFTSDDLLLPTLNLSEQTDLITAAAVLERAHAVVGNDSGLGHIAAALGVPTLTVFGPGDPERYRPRGPHVKVAYAPNKDLQRLSAADVSNALDELMSEI